MKCTRCERLLLEKPFYLCKKITLDSEQQMLKHNGSFRQSEVE